MVQASAPSSLSSSRSPRTAVVLLYRRRGYAMRPAFTGPKRAASQARRRGMIAAIRARAAVCSSSTRRGVASAVAAIRRTLHAPDNWSSRTACGDATEDRGANGAPLDCVDYDDIHW